MLTHTAQLRRFILSVNNYFQTIIFRRIGGGARRVGRMVKLPRATGAPFDKLRVF
jgi:hypothetical protein